jgi:hypothetical protein
VQILGNAVGWGFAIEIEDRGIGLTAERLAEINRDLTSPPEFDLSGSDRIGLFIAGQLAQRHGIKITLRDSPFGGIAAIILIPQDLVVAEGTYESDPSIAGNGGLAVRLPGRHASLSNGTDDGTGRPATSAHPPASWASPPDATRPVRPPATAGPSEPSVSRSPAGSPPLRMGVDRLADPLPSTGEVKPAQPFSTFGPATTDPQRHAPHGAGGTGRGPT